MSLQYLQAQSSGAHEDSVWKISWTSRNEVVTASADGGIRVWDNQSPSKPKHHLNFHPLGVTSLSISSDGLKALSVSVEGSVVLSDLEYGKKLGGKNSYKEEIGEEAGILPAWSAAIHPSGSSYATTGSGAKVGFYQISEGEEAVVNVDEDITKEDIGGSLSGGCLKLLETGKGRFGMDLCYSPDGRSLALSTETGHIVIIDVETQTVVANHSSHSLCSRTLSWSPDSQWLFSGSDDRRIVLHDIRAGSASGGSGRGSAAVAELHSHTSWVLGVSASDDNRLLLSGGADSTVKVFDVGQRACVSSTQTTSQVWAVGWQPLAANQANGGSKAFVTGGDDLRASWWKAAGSA